MSEEKYEHIVYAEGSVYLLEGEYTASELKAILESFGALKKSNHKMMEEVE